MSINPDWEISVQDVHHLRSRRQEFLLLDVRQPDEFARCRIDGAHLVPLGELPARLEEVRDLAAGRPVVTQCHHGGRSLSAAAILREAGISTAKSMAGGIDAWSIQIDPTVPRY